MERNLTAGQPVLGSSARGPEVIEQNALERQASEGLNPADLMDWLLGAEVPTPKNIPAYIMQRVGASNDESYTRRARSYARRLDDGDADRAMVVALYLTGHATTLIPQEVIDSIDELVRRTDKQVDGRRDVQHRKVGGKATHIAEWPVLQIGPVSDDEDWHDRALCAQTDPEAFFPEKGGSTREAKKICTGCEVKAECLAYALDNDERFGIWGGLSERERRRLKKRKPDAELAQ